jgi:hypothetical protein
MTTARKERVSFRVCPADSALIDQIVQRFMKEFPDSGFTDVLGMQMDITACHANGNPLKLQQLLDADGFNFAHDVAGICNRIDRSTGHMTNLFSPRFSV